MLGIITGLIGSISYVKKQTLLADAVAHATLPGIAMTFLIIPDASVSLLIIGGIITGVIGASMIALLSALLPLKKDAIIGTILAVFLGIGLMLMTCIQKTVNARQACLNKFLYGNASLLLREDMTTIIGIACLLLVAITLLMPTYKVRLFDTQFAEIFGIASSIWDIIFMLLFVTIIAVGIQTVGVILISSMLICPILTVFSPYRSFSVNAYNAALWGGIVTIIGSLLSYYLVAPPGPCITLTQGIIAFISLMSRSHFTQQVR